MTELPATANESSLPSGDNSDTVPGPINTQDGSTSMPTSTAMPSAAADNETNESPRLPATATGITTTTTTTTTAGDPAAGKRDHDGQKVVGERGKGADAIDAAAAAVMSDATGMGIVATGIYGSGNVDVNVNSIYGGSNSNKRGKREWLSFRGNRQSRVGDDYQVTSLPPVLQPTGTTTTAAAAAAAATAENNGNGR
eukprot:jgi/Psemu1/7725/gm1.7725_g